MQPGRGLGIDRAPGRPRLRVDPIECLGGIGHHGRERPWLSRDARRGLPGRPIYVIAPLHIREWVRSFVLEVMARVRNLPYCYS
jgi:hypothetical protein